MNRPLFPTTLDSVLRHRELSRVKDLSAPPRILLKHSRWFVHLHCPSASILLERVKRRGS